MSKDTTVTWYRLNFISEQIEEVNVTEDNEYYVWVVDKPGWRPRGEAKSSQWYQYFKSKKDTLQYLVDTYRKQIDVFENELPRLKFKLTKTQIELENVDE